MRRVFLCLVGLLVASSVYGQAPAGGNAPAAAPQAPGMAKRTTSRHSQSRGGRFKADVPASTPIVTLDGVCSQTSKTAGKSAAPCKTVVTRAQLDAILDAVEPNAAPRMRQLFAISYARLLASAQIAEDEHLDSSPEVLRAIQTQQKLARMQVLADAVYQKLEKQAEHVPMKEVEAYYKQYLTTFEEARVQRVAIPLNATTESGKPLDKDAAKAKMEELRARALQGADFEELQARAYNDSGIKDPVPHTGVTLMRRSALSPEETKVFEMDLGATTAVFENQGAFMFLHVLSRRMQPLSETQEQIEAVLLQQRLQEEMQDAAKGISAQFNLKYIGTPTQPELFPPSMGLGSIRRGMLSSMHVQP